MNVQVLQLSLNKARAKPIFNIRNIIEGIA